MGRRLKTEFMTKDRYIGNFLTVGDVVVSVLFTTALIYIMCVRGGMKVLSACIVVVILDVILLILRVYDREHKGNMSHITSVIDKRIEELERLKWDDPLNGDIYQDEIDMLKSRKEDLNQDNEKDN